MQAPASKNPISGVALQEKIDSINKALSDASIVADELTLTALSMILANACVISGVKKQQFMQIMRDNWRSYSSQYQNAGNRKHQIANYIEEIQKVQEAPVEASTQEQTDEQTA